jgi:hypothetical protein
VVDDAQFECVSGCEPSLLQWLRFVHPFFCVVLSVASGCRINRQMCLLQVYWDHVNSSTVYQKCSIFAKSDTGAYICRTHTDVILFQSKKSTASTTFGRKMYTSIK